MLRALATTVRAEEDGTQLHRGWVPREPREVGEWRVKGGRGSYPTVATTRLGSNVSLYGSVGDMLMRGTRGLASSKLSPSLHGNRTSKDTYVCRYARQVATRSFVHTREV